MEATAQSRQQSQGVETHRVLNPALNPSVTTGNSNDKRSSYSSSGQFFSSFKNMDRLRRENQLCDVTIVVGTTRILAHKVVLASSSAYFEAMFTRGMMESREQEIELHGIDSTSLEQLVNFMYTSNIEISEDNVQNLLPVSNVIQIESVRLACCEFLKNQLAPCNCLGILMFADTHGCLDLLETAKMYALRHFVEVSKTEEFLNLSIKRLIELVGENNLCAHDESQVYNAILSWIKHDLSHRSQHIGDLLSLIKLPLLSRDFLMFTVEPEELIRSNSECKDLVIEAMKYHLLPELRPYLQNTRTKPRQNIDEVPVVFSIGGGSLFAIHCECECYDPRNNRWCMVAPMSVRRARLGVGVVYGLVYAIGGFDGSHDLASVEIYNPKTNEWSMSTPMGTKRSSLGVAVLHNLLYAVGGYDGASCLSSVERYDPLLQQWSSVAPMTFRRYFRLFYP